MLLRILTIRVTAGSQAELEERLRSVSSEVFEAQTGLLRYDIARTISDGGDLEYVLTSLWSGVAALQGMAGEDWQRAHIPEAISPFLESCRIQHFDVLASGPRTRP